jgi:cobalt-precorrin-5B (C1)-methyltransferase
MDMYVVKNGKRLKCGYTTGSCAAAAAKCATQMLFTGEVPDTVFINTPAGCEAWFRPHDAVITNTYAQCAIIKDAGDDPDITDGIKIFARAEYLGEDKIVVKGGTGIGVVTMKGLPVKPGNPAINPVPMKMIMNEVEKASTAGKGVTITVSAPEGVKIAERTFNPKLGIEGGISILGTTGIVEPMSNEAVKESMSLEISMLRERGMDKAVFVPGKYGKDFAMNSYSVPGSRIISTGNYIGYMMQQAVYYGIKDILLVGHTGKLIKVAGGNFDTHSRVADARFEIITANYILLGGSPETAVNIMKCRTTEEALDIIDIDGFFQYMCDKIRERCIDHVHRKLNVEVVIFSMEKGFLAQTPGAVSLIERMRNIA